MTTSLIGRKAALLAVAGALIVSGCSSAKPEGGGSVPADPINVAIMAPLTGNAALEGENAKNAATLAVDAINVNSAAGTRKISVEYFDTKADPTQAANIAQKLVTEYQDGKISAVIGPAHSDEALAVLPIFSRAKVPVIGTTPSNPTLTQKGYGNFIRMVPSDADQSTQQVAFAYNNQSKRRFGIFYENNDFGQGLKDFQVDAIKNHASGASVVAVETYIPGETRDFSTQVTKMMRANPDVVLLDTGYTEGGLIVRQADQVGMKVTWVASGNNLYQDFIKLASGSAEGVYVLTSFNQFSSNPTTSDFLKNYQQKFDSLPAEGAYTTYDALFLVKQIIDDGKQSSDVIAAAKGMTFKGVGGDYHWTDTGDASIPLSVDVVKDGKFTDADVKVDLAGFEQK